MHLITSTNIKTRESSFELIRIIAQYFIVLYHLYCFFVYPTTNNSLHKAIWLPLHIGVILFVLISGYFRIKASIRGLIKLVGMMFVLYIPLAIPDLWLSTITDKKIQETFFFVSASPFWFMRTYLFLYLISPVLNTYINKSTNKQLLSLGISLFFISIYCGTISYDSSLLMGKNLPTFMFLYVLGYILNRFKTDWQKIKTYKFAILFILYNTFIIVLFSFWHGPLSNMIFNRLCFMYCSVGLLISSILFFMWIGKLQFHSSFVNYIAKSSITIYMLHGANLIFYQLIGPVVSRVLNFGFTEIIQFLLLSLIALLIISCCVIIDKMLNPVWNQLDKFGNFIQIKWRTINL